MLAWLNVEPGTSCPYKTKRWTGYPRESAARVHYPERSRSQRSGARSMLCDNEHWQVKMHGLQGKLCDAMGTLQPPREDSSLSLSHFVLILFLFYLFFGFSFKFGLVLEGRLQGQRVDVRGQGEKWDRNAWGEIHKESIKVEKRVIDIGTHSQNSNIIHNFFTKHIHRIGVICHTLLARS